MFYPEPRSPGGKALWGILQSFRRDLEKHKLQLRQVYSSHREKVVAEWLYYHERGLVESMEGMETEYCRAHGLLKPGETVALCIQPGCNHFFDLPDSSDDYECPKHRKVLDVEAPPVKAEVSEAERHRYAMASRDQQHRISVRKKLAALRAEAAAL